MHRVKTSGFVTRFLVFAAFLLLVLSQGTAEASTITKIKGKQGIVSFTGGETPAAGDKFFAIENGKRKAVVEIVQFKNGKARIKILKGNAKAGMSIAAAGSKGKSSAKAPPPGEDVADEEAPAGKPARSAGAATLFKDMTVGVVGGYAMDSQTVNIAGQSVAMTGSGFSVKGFADIPVAGSLSLLPRAGAEQFNVQNGNAKTSILYAVADLLLKYSFGGQSFVPFAMGGLGIHFPLSKSSELALDVNRISSTTVFFGGGGFNFVMGGSSYFQLTAEYGFFPPSNDVTTSFIAVRSGLGFRF